MKTTLTAFQRNFREARESADNGQPVLITGENAHYIFMKRPADTNPLVGLEGVFGAVALGAAKQSPREKIRTRLAKNRRN
jgi:hypothetical protein